MLRRYHDLVMQVAELSALHEFRLTERSIADPGPAEVQVRVGAVGICGSDLHYFSEGAIGGTECIYPMVLGHEPAGQVVRCGSGVSGWFPGDHALLEPAQYCYRCEFCRTGHQNVCTDLKFLSSPGHPGFFRELVNLPARNLLPVPKPLSLVEATLFEPLAVVLHSLQFGALRPGETAAVFGAGPIGLLTLIALKLYGAGRVWMVDPIAHRREQARSAGADAVLDSNSNPVQQILADTGGRGVDAAIDCAAKNDTINQCLDVTRSAGRVVITGIPSDPEIKVNFQVIRRKELSVFPVRRSNHETGEALRMMSEYPVRFASLITHTRPIDKIQRAFELLENYEDGVGKIVITLPLP